MRRFIENKSVNIDKFVFYICLVDTLFLPYIRSIHASVSMIILILWYAFNLKKIKVTTEFTLLAIFLAFMVTSLIFQNFIFASQSFWVEVDVTKQNLIRFSIITYLVLYYIFYRYYFTNYQFKIKNVLIAYVLFGLILALIYSVNPSLSFDIRSFWTMGGANSSLEQFTSHYRFTSTLSDPNNASVAFVAVMAVLILNNKPNFKLEVFTIGAVVMITISTMSITGIISYLIILTIYSFKKIRGLIINKRFHLSAFILLLLISFSALVVFMTKVKVDSVVLKDANTRYSYNSADSRTERWKELLTSDQIVTSAIIGNGGTILVEGNESKPHNGHIFLYYSYGVFSYLIFMYVFFRKRKGTSYFEYFFIIPLFLGFSVNIGIYDMRFATLFALLIAAYSSKIKLVNSNDKV